MGPNNRFIYLAEHGVEPGQLGKMLLGPFALGDVADGRAAPRTARGHGPAVRFDDDPRAVLAEHGVLDRRLLPLPDAAPSPARGLRGQSKRQSPCPAILPRSSPASGRTARCSPRSGPLRFRQSLQRSPPQKSPAAPGSRAAPLPPACARSRDGSPASAAVAAFGPSPNSPGRRGGGPRCPGPHPPSPSER